MPRFHYQARSSDGEALKGVVSAESAADATRTLRTEGKFVIRLRELSDAAEQAASAPIRFGGKRVKRDDVIFFTAQMAVMVETGVSITDALQGIIEQCESPAFHRVLSQVLSDVETGLPFSDALARHPRVFKPLVISLVRASEVSGRLGTMLQRCSDYLTKQRETRRKVVGALIYPAFLMFMSVGVAVFLLVFLMPRFTTIYANKQDVLPLPTKILIAVSDWLSTHWMTWSVLLVMLVTSLLYYLSSSMGRNTLHWSMLRMPLIGRMLHKTYLTRTLSTLGTLIEAGVAMLDAVSITADVAGNTYFRRMWEEVGRRVEHGEQVSRPLFKSNLMPRSVTQMISAGERSGHLALVLERVSGFLEQDLDQAIKRVTNMIEPLMIVIMGTLVGGIAIALLLPIFTISKVVSH